MKVIREGERFAETMSEMGSTMGMSPRAACTRRSALIGLAAFGLAPSRALAQSATRYRLRLTMTWSRETHPHDFPAGAHFSDLIGATHDARYSMFADGHTASSGLKLLAENGRSSILREELAEATRRRRVGSIFVAEGLYTLPGSINAEFDIGPQHRLVSFATMIAPSPDWFTGLAGIDLAPGGNWLDRVERPLWAWDAGTDSGATFEAPDADQQPRSCIRLISTPHFLGDAGLLRLGTALMERVG
jgi:hypothetical protein